MTMIHYANTLVLVQVSNMGAVKPVGFINSTLETYLKENRQPFPHILHHTHLGISLSTLYRYVENHTLSIKAIDFVLKVRYKPRKKEKSPSKASINSIHKGRTYPEFLTY